MYNLAEEMHQEGRLQARYTWLADGTKLAVEDNDGSGYAYIGSLVYRNDKGTLSLESCSFGAGRIAVSMVGVTKTTVPYYYLTDHLGSTRVVVDGAGKVLERNDYLPFGLRWNKSERPVSDNRYLYNGKELQVTGQLNLLDYGARMYDPWLGRWVSPDPAMQLANPYAFCGNNPIIYVDEDGQFFLSFLIGFFRGLFKGDNPFKTGWHSGAMTTKILWGLFKGNFGQILSRLTWELPQTFLGVTFSVGANWIGDVESVNYAYGATVTKDCSGGNWGAMTLGSFIIGDKKIEANPYNTLFQHEYGHYLQSRKAGWACLFQFAFPSLISAAVHGHEEHNAYYTEQSANRLALKFWERKMPGFYKDGWNWKRNKIKGFDTGKQFDSPTIQNALNGQSFLNGETNDGGREQTSSSGNDKQNENITKY